MRSAFGVEHTEVSKAWGSGTKAVRSIKLAGARRGAKAFTPFQAGWGKGKKAAQPRKQNTRLSRWS